VDNVSVLLPFTGQSPVVAGAAYNPETEANVLNGLRANGKGYWFRDDEWVHLTWDEAAAKWRVHKIPRLRCGTPTGTPTNEDLDAEDAGVVTDKVFELTSCDRDGNADDTGTFNGYLMPDATHASAIFSGVVYACELDEDGDYHILSPHAVDDRMYTVKMFADDAANIPQGWRICNGTPVNGHDFDMTQDMNNASGYRAGGLPRMAEDDADVGAADDNVYFDTIGSLGVTDAMPGDAETDESDGHTHDLSADVAEDARVGVWFIERCN